ncbi:glycosyltransferase [Ornithinimicrobium flavum]|uniref:glycosyltransferase n=1 Tax=Ornithinimicrobium flavum TaxID=1288636 RepID=UPI00106F1A0F|nr:glycosyltransferase [Ornithinimicrobium flavum]
MTAPRPFDHVLLTRFSAVMVPGAPPATEEWLHYRLGFFYDACLPSVTRQRGAQPFDWLVLFDDRCSDDFRAQVGELAEGAFTPIWSSEPFRRDSFAGPVADRADAAYLITTRIDSDDAMAVDFMARVQTEFAGQERMFVNFPRGVQIDRTGAVYRSNIVSSPFLSLIERREEGRPPETVFVAKHARARGHAPVRQVHAPVMWAQVVHGTNVSNIVNGRQTAPTVVRERFDLDLTYDATLGGGRLWRAQVGHAARLVNLWARHPGELAKWAEATAVTARGTRTWGQDAGVPFAERLDLATKAQRRRLRDGRFALKEKVNSLGRGWLRVVAGDVEQVLAGDRVVVMAEWSPGRDVRSSALRAAQAYAAAGWPTLVVAARDPWTRLRAPSVPSGVAVVSRPNSAYDFGSWRDALSAYPQIAGKARVILTNDSLEGPAGSLEELTRRITTSDAQVWGATWNRRPRPHLQSSLMVFSGGVLGLPDLQRFFADVAPQQSKEDVILAYEIGLSALVRELGLSTATGWSQDELGMPPDANALLAWEVLLDAGFPFVKRVLLTEPRFAAWRPAIEARLADVHRMYPR